MKVFKTRKAYFIKMLVTMVSVFSGIAVISSLYIGYSNYQALHKERDVLNVSRMSAFKQNTDIQINTAVARIENYRNDTIFMQYATNYAQDESISAKVYEKLNESQFLFSNIGISLGVINPKTQQCIMSDGYNKIDISRLGIDYDNLPLINYTLAKTDGFVPMIDGQDKDGAVFVINQKYSGDYNLTFVFVLYNINNFSVVDVDNYAVAYGDMIAFTSNQLAFPGNILDINDDTVHSGENGVYMQHSDVLPQLRYYYYTNMDIHGIGLKNAIIAILMIAVGMIIAVFIVIKLYEPINKAVTGFNIINKQDYSDEIEYMTQTADKMYNDIAKLTKSKEEQSKLVINKFTHDLCLGILTNEEAKDFIEKYSMDMLKNKHFVINTEIIELGGELSGIDNYAYKNVKHDIIEMFVNDVIGSENYYLFEPSNSRTAFVLNGNVKNYTERINALFANLEAQYGIDMAAAVGSVSENYTQTERSYLDTVNLLDNHIFAGDSYVALPEEIRQYDDSELYYPFEVEERIIENMVSAKCEAAVRLLEKVLEINLEKGMTAHKWVELKCLAMSTINRILAKINENAETVFGEDVVLYLELGGKRNEDPSKRIREVFLKLGEYIERNEHLGNEQLSDIVKFIDSNIDKDISLVDLAQYLNLTPSYVSRLFKNIVKQNFKVYINQRRVEIAKRILHEEKNIKIADLAARVGCNNTVTFTRIFKKYTGMTPSEYLS